MMNGNSSGDERDTENTRQVADGPTCRTCTRLDSLSWLILLLCSPFTFVKRRKRQPLGEPSSLTEKVWLEAKSSDGAYYEGIDQV